ncbi:RHS repeat domain-containing protein [Chryseobacterium sp. T20]|uniref:RHS repeat domain-containing protein n=1 Tax=Chryseobacterium sp. T20 TaxID=3395375 RepID=UPI0039BCAC64
MKRIVSIASLGFALFINAQTLSNTENYIYSKTCLDETCTKKSEAVQYADGFGRNKQVISIGATPAGKDIVQHIEYDNYDRQGKSFLPVPQAGSQGGAIYSSPLANANAVYGSEKIYSEKIFQNDISGQVKQVIPVGNAWASHPLQLAVSANASGDQVRKITVVTSWLNNATSYTLNYNPDYAPNQLSKSIATDGDGNTTTEFKNGSSKTLLVRKNDGTKPIDTYYLYDEFGNLAYVIPPLASAGMSASAPLTTAVLDNLCYQYHYDSQGRQVEKKLPGKGWEYIIYDQQDRVIMTQDAKLRTLNNTFSAKGWLFTRYDKWGRVLYSGFFPSQDSRGILQNNINNVTVNAENNESRTSASFTANGMQVFYTQNAFPTGNITVLSVNYYDTYPAYSFNPAFPATILGQNVITDVSSVSTKGFPTLSLVKNIEDNNWTKNYVYYNTKGMAIGTYSINHLDGYTKTETEFDFAGVMKQTKAYHKRVNTDTEKIISQIYEYDSKNRLKKQWHQVGSQPQELLAEITYNELSQLSNKKVGNNLQNIDYTYDIRGTLTKLNDPAQLGTKLFGFELKYTNPQNTANSPAKYNGNITEVTWKTSTDNVLRQYNYQYDALNRLKKGIYSEPNASAPQNGLYNETVEYDSGSNITSLKRNTGMSGMAALMDDLTYNYTGNKLNSVTDISTNYNGYSEISGNMISYDDNGNMANHKDKGVLQIDYNFLNLPDYVKFDTSYRSHDTSVLYNVNTRYTYRADGTKIRKVYTYGSGRGQFEAANIVDYLDGFQYEGDDIVSSSLPAMTLKFVPTSEGYYNFENNRYIYSYTDHLGNVRLSYFKNTNGSAEALEENNYYPFGLKHLGYNNVGGNPSYNYQYNSKELQKETGWNDYGARMYMADIGRWGVIDPLAETSRRFTPYNYALNNPVNFIDPDGRKAVPVPYEGMENHLVEGSYMWQMLGGSFNPHQKVPNGSGGSSADFGGFGYTDSEPSSGGLSFTSLEAITFAQSYFGGGGNIGALFSMVEQLKAAGFKDPANMKASFSDWYKLVNSDKIPSLNDLYKVTLAEFIDNTGGSCPNKTEYQRIWINMNNVENILKFAFTLGHEMNHSFADQFFKDQFSEITRQSKNSIPFHGSFGFFQEVMGLSWEIKFGSERYGDRSGFEAAKFYYGPNGLGYGQRSIDTVNRYLYDLKNAWDLIYQSKLK